MDPLTALGVACNVAQIVECALKTTSAIRETYRKGASDNLISLQNTSSHLKEVASSLSDSILPFNVSKPLSKDEAQLRTLATNCVEIAADAQKEVDSLRSHGGRRDAFRKGVKSIWKHRDIEKLEKALQVHRATLETGLLARLSQQIDLTAVTQQDDFEKLDDNLQRFIESLRAGHTRLEDLLTSEANSTRTLIDQEHTRTRSHITTALRSQRFEDITDAQTAQFLRSLKFDKINARRNHVSDNEFETFEWIFDEKIDRLWHSFVDWLQNGNSLYWISGKAGSGKSTLMKFICEDERTRETLRVWNPHAEPLMLSFFFWNSGTTLQRSLKGLLCSLLLRLLEKDDAVLSQLLNASVKLRGKEQVDDWSTNELKEATKFVFDLISQQRPMCLFLDGLDEFDQAEDPTDLLRFIRQLVSRDNVKACVSSRPEILFLNALGNYPRLRLQDLTRDDIKKYVSNTLLQGLAERRIQIDNFQKMHELQTMVLEKAEGVFLWVSLAMKSLIRGFNHQDGWDTLLKRLDQLPGDMEKLYEQMWGRLNDDQELYRQQAALYFQLCLQADVRDIPGLSLFNFTVAVNDSIHLARWEPETLSQYDYFVEECKKTITSINSRCAGLLEVYGIEEEISNKQLPYHGGDEYARNRLKLFKSAVDIDFIHRTARDFLTQTAVGRSILNHQTINDAEVYVRILNGDLLWMLLSDDNLKVRGLLPVNRELGRLRDAAAKCHMSGAQQIRILNALSHTCHLFHSRHSIEDTGGTWFRASDPGLAGWTLRDIEYDGHALDFLGLAFDHGIFEVLGDDKKLWKPQMNKFSDTYKQYLLLCACFRWKRRWLENDENLGLAVIEELLDSGTNLAALWYSPTWSPLRTSSWIMFLIGLNLFTSVRAPAIQVPRIRLIIKRFLDCGADPNEQGIFQFGPDTGMETVIWGTDGETDGPLIVIVNAVYLFRTWSSGKSGSGFVEDHRLRHLEPFCKVLLMENYKQNGFKVINDKDSSSLLDCDAIRPDIDKNDETDILKLKLLKGRMREIHDRLEKEGNQEVYIKEYLKVKGFYKDPKDPAVRKPPFERFKEPHSQVQSLDDGDIREIEY